MERSHTDIPLAELRSKFELLLEDLAVLHAEMQALRRELHERQELSSFLLKVVVDDLASHRHDPAAHPSPRTKQQGRLVSRPCPSCPAPPAAGRPISGQGTA